MPLLALLLWLNVPKRLIFPASTPATNPVSLMVWGMPTIPVPITALTRLDVAPEMVVFFSLFDDGGFLNGNMKRDHSPGGTSKRVEV